VPIGRIPESGEWAAVTVVTGIQAAGKSTVAQGLAERLPRSVQQPPRIGLWLDTSDQTPGRLSTRSCAARLSRAFCGRGGRSIIGLGGAA
jgi:hypothetical protein